MLSTIAGKVNSVRSGPPLPTNDRANTTHDTTNRENVIALGRLRERSEVGMVLKATSGFC